MRLVPVLDLKNGQVVRGIGGRREEYRPIVSRLTASHEPFDVARALVAGFLPSELYIADLDAIAGNQPDWSSLAAIQSLGVDLWVDIGIKDAADAQELAAAGCAAIVCGLESLAGLDALEELARDLGTKRLIFSLDLRNGAMLGNLERWPVRDARDTVSVIDCVARLGIRRLIVLDLARVGEGRGIGTEELCRCIASRHPEMEIIAGGGIRDMDDLRRLAASGASAALVASALHDQTILPARNAQWHKCKLD
jgi:phosphoribosylformimino-5-aminoimidazole carboxamide ribotide isomerase